MMKNAVIAALTAALALSVAAGVLAARAERTATVEVRIWEDVADPAAHWVSSRIEGGEWTERVALAPLNEGFVQSGRYRYGDVFVNATEPQPLPPAIELFGVACEERGHPGPAHLVLRGSFRNGANATISDVVITAALVDEDGVEVLRGTDEVAGAIGPGGVRSFGVSFSRAPGVTGACPILSIDYRAAVRYEVPVP